ncbi:MAG: DNA-binding protein [Deltaproteobacteria bacterium]|nr:MAG: DNA-binding protein [Deltaproteobacteria bacterium]
MPNITVKNIPESAYETLKQIAAAHHRSINSEIVHLIEKSTSCKPVNLRQHIAFARQFREKTRKVLLTEEIISQCKTEGRP